jgi:hypothetical protein
MAWQETTTVMVRILINDMDDTNYTYSNERLEQTILVSAQMVNSMADFQNSYTPDLTQLTLTPDPTNDPVDNDYINLISVKAACIILGNEAKTSAGNSLLVKDGPSTIDTRMASGSLLNLYKDVCDKFHQMIMDYKAGKSIAGQSILGPNSPASWNYRSGGFLDAETRNNTY